MHYIIILLLSSLSLQISGFYNMNSTQFIKLFNVSQ